MPAAAIKVIFHIGLERTGTTSFQQFCTGHARQLARQGVLYPVKCLAFAQINHAPLAASYLNPHRPPDFYLQTRHARDLMLKSLRKEIEGSGAKTVILSSEHFSSRFRHQEIAALAQDFADYDCKVVMVLRDHFRRFLSSYSVHIMSGAVQTLDEYAEMILQPDNLYLRHAETISLWAQSFGKANIAALDYCRSEDITNLIFEQVGLSHLRPAQAGTSNRSLDARAAEALRLVNVAAQAHKKTTKATSYFVFQKQKYIRLLMKHQLAHGPGPICSWRLAGGLRERLHEIAEADRTWLAENYDLCVEPVLVPSLFESYSQTPVEDEPDLLTQTLVQMVDAQSSPSRMLLHVILSSGMETIQRCLRRFKQGKPKCPR